MTTREEILDLAKEAVTSRMAAYGDPKVSFGRTAEVWTALLNDKLDDDLTASDVCLLLSALKLVRLSFCPLHKDSYVDLAGYASCMAECVKNGDK